MNLETFLAEKKRLIDHTLMRMIPKLDCPYSQLFDAANYSLFGEGKRIRPILTLATAEALGVSSDLALTPACTIELLHCYSLIHDDLPSMDNDDFRRGKPTLHKAYPEGLAVLTGDYLLTYAMEALADCTEINAETRITLIGLLAQKAGAHGMIGGQVMDLDSEGKAISLDRLKHIHRCKTGALLSTAVQFGGLIANADAETMGLLVDFASDLGLAFQVVDDILDLTAGKEKHGLAGGTDVLREKATFISLLGLEASQNYAIELQDHALNTLKQIPADTRILEELTVNIISRSQ